MKLMNKLFLSCEKATALLEKRHHIKLTTRESIQLKMHVAMCKPCTKYEKQSAILEEQLQNNYKSTQTEAGVVDALKEKIAKSLAH